MSLCLTQMLRFNSWSGTNSLDPMIVGSWPRYPRNAEVRAVEVLGNRALVGLDSDRAGRSGFLVMAVDVPTEPKVLGGFKTSGSLKDLVVMNELVLLAKGTNGLEIVDAQSPGNPVLAGSFVDGSDQARIFTTGEIALTAGTNGATLFDLSVPSQPRILSRIPGIFTDVGAENGTAFLASYESFQAVDIKNPGAPVLLGTFAPGQAIRRIWVTNGLAFLAEYPTGIELIDVTDPTNLKKRSTYETFIPTSIITRGPYGFVGRDYQGFDIVDIADPAAPVRVTTHDPDEFRSTIFEVALLNDYLFLAAGFGGLQIADVSEPKTPRIVSEFFSAWGQSYSLAVTQGYTLLADGGGGLRVIDVRQPRFPKQVANLKVGDAALGVTLAGRYALVSHGSGSQLMDLQDPAEPRVVASYTIPFEGASYIPDKNVIHAWDYLIRLTEPFPVEKLMRSYLSTGQPPSLGNLLFFYAGAELNIIDISDENKPVRIGRYVANGGIEDLAVRDHFVFLAVHSRGLAILDVRDPSNPVVAGSYASLRTGRSLAVKDNRVFLADWISPALMILDVSDVAHPMWMGELKLPSEAHDIAAVGNLVFVAAWDTGLQVIDLTGTLEPSLNISRYKESTFVELGGRLGNKYSLEQTDSLAIGNWAERAVVTLTNNPQTVIRVGNEQRTGFYRTRSQ